LPVGPKVPLDIRLTAGWTYIRLHRGWRGIGFSQAELTEWAERVGAWRDQGADVYVYFNNDTRGHAIRNALALRRMLA
jgi:uncharacterized protein YecE (DUF72 family)